MNCIFWGQSQNRSSWTSYWIGWGAECSRPIIAINCQFLLTRTLRKIAVPAGPALGVHHKANNRACMYERSTLFVPASEHLQGISSVQGFAMMSATKEWMVRTRSATRSHIQRPPFVQLRRFSSKNEDRFTKEMGDQLGNKMSGGLFVLTKNLIFIPNYRGYTLDYP